MNNKTRFLGLVTGGALVLAAGCSGKMPQPFSFGSDGGVDGGGCQSGETRQGDSPCGLNQRGAFQQVCNANDVWEDSQDVCIDPDVCIDDATQIGDTDCTSGPGKQEQICVMGQWEDTELCSNAIECVDKTEQQVGTCGENGDKTFHQRCVAGYWEGPGTCLYPDECLDGSIQKGTKACGTGNPQRGYMIQQCKDNAWTDLECHDMNLDIGGPCDCIASTGKPCQQMIPVVNTVMKYFWDIDIQGCDYVKKQYADWPNAQVTCMRSQKGSLNPQFWANGYCTLASVGCSGNTAMCNVIPTGGNYKDHTSCPPGTVLLEEKFFTAGLNFTLYNKLCLQSCQSDSDCRITESDPIHGTPAPAYKCFEDATSGGIIKYCWDDQNLTSKSHKVTQF